MSILESGLFALGQVLRLPVMLLLWCCVGAAVFMTGACLVEWVARLRDRRGFDIGSWLEGGDVLDAADQRLAALPAPLRGLVRDVEAMRSRGVTGDGALEHLLLAREDRIRQSVNPSRMLVKVGPSLGLLGTLIPMGSSLASLAGGNLEAMAGQMIVAFTTTIIGLATGTLAYVVAAARQGWIADTVREQRYLAERLALELDSRMKG